MERWLIGYTALLCLVIVVLGLWQGIAIQRAALHLADTLAPIATPRGW